MQYGVSQKDFSLIGHFNRFSRSIDLSDEGNRKTAGCSKRSLRDNEATVLIWAKIKGFLETLIELDCNWL